MRLDEMLNIESCDRVWGYRPTEEQVVILNDTDAMRELLIKIWESTKEVSRVYK